VALSESHGASWTIDDDGLQARVLMRLAAPSATTLLAADLQGGVHVSQDGGVTWTTDDLGVPGQPVADLATPSPGVVLAATGAGLRRAVAPFATWQPVVGLPDSPARLVTIADTRALVLVEGHGLFASDDSGNTWRSLTTPFQALPVAAARFGARSQIYIATRNAEEVIVWRSADSGQQWQRWLVEPAGAAEVVPLATSPTSADVFAALTGRVLHPLLYATARHGGERRPVWRSALLETGAAVTDLAVSPDYARDNSVLAATNVGVFASRDGGERFEPWSAGLKPASVVSLLWSEPSTVRALTLGGTLWQRYCR
jgi:photosystem II stability/assembly factor-like uncharacterized protein